MTLGAIAQLRVKGGSSGRADWEADDPGEQGVRGATRELSPGVSAERQSVSCGLVRCVARGHGSQGPGVSSSVSAPGRGRLSP